MQAVREDVHVPKHDQALPELLQGLPGKVQGEEGMTYEEATAMMERIEEWPWKPVDADPYFVTKIYEEQVPREFLFAVLAFPALRFY